MGWHCIRDLGIWVKAGKRSGSKESPKNVLLKQKQWPVLVYTEFLFILLICIGFPLFYTFVNANPNKEKKRKEKEFSDFGCSCIFMDNSFKSKHRTSCCSEVGKIPKSNRKFQHNELTGFELLILMKFGGDINIKKLVYTISVVSLTSFHFSIILLVYVWISKWHDKF